MTTGRKNDLEYEFESLTKLPLKFDLLYRKELDPFLMYLNDKTIRPTKERFEAFIALVNKKFELNSKVLASLYARAAFLGFTFNFHQKNLIQRSFDLCDGDLFKDTLIGRKIEKKIMRDLFDFFRPVSEKETITYLQQEYHNPSRLRIKNGDRGIENEIVKALFSAFLWGSLPTKDMHAYFDPNFSSIDYRESFWQQLQLKSPNLFNRDNALHIMRVDQKVSNKFIDYSSLRNELIGTISSLFKTINNYGFLSILVEPLSLNNRAIEWELSSDLILAAEKFQETPLKKNYFQWDRIRNETSSYIEKLEDQTAKFDLANEGFTYKDTFVIGNHKNKIEKILIIFQKNERDETTIPCPACRSYNVQGNSYSSLGVKSWECNNLLCPDRTKYNRGKRYSFKSLLMQQAIEDDNSIVPNEFTRAWKRDVVMDAPDEDILEMLIRHYSIHKDTVHLYNWELAKRIILGRAIKQQKIVSSKSYDFFNNAHIFKRYVLEKSIKPVPLVNLGDEGFQVYAGDAANILSNFQKNTFDGAITSPPYFNAREYSQWSNIYCYLHDMLHINKEVFRTLKPGAIYLYNIFDYFDNENSVALSAMAQKRMILSAYTVDLFRRIGFELSGNIVWDKGDIEGKRGFNSGNFSPFYQAPFNCWEHILIFKKPVEGLSNISNISSKIFPCKPVHKMVRGKNMYGHTAPFPEALPLILTSTLPKGSFILDPFAGSLTTGRVAEKEGYRSVNIELSEEYCELGLDKRKNAQPALQLKLEPIIMLR